MRTDGDDNAFFRIHCMAAKIFAASPSKFISVRFNGARKDFGGAEEAY